MQTGNARALTRRQFAALVGGGMLALAGGTMIGCTPKSEASEKLSRTVSCDVLVVGGGGAGVSAAAMAAGAGANTILIEKEAWLAGSSSLALGNFYGAGTQLQKEKGIDDNAEDFLAYLLRRGGDKLDRDIQVMCSQEFGKTVDWLREELGVPFKDTLALKGTDTVPRAHNCKNSAMDALRAVTALARENGVQFHFGMPAESLVVDNGAVTGVLARSGAGELVQYSAKKTIMATGGFCRNPEMIDKYMPDYSGVYTEVGVGLTGEGLQMGLNIGADYIGHGGTNGILACPVEPGQSKLISAKAMWVNSAGERFANEGGQTHDIYYQVAHFSDQKFFAVYDQAMYDALNDTLKANFDRGLESGVFAKGDTAAEAANALGVNGSALQASLDTYNEMAHAGEDTQFKKKAANLKPIETAPFYVLTMGVCTHGSFGGYHVNTDLQVLDTSGNPIPNFYSAGEVCCGSFIYDDYPSGGCGLNWSYTSGRLAGEKAAAAAAQA